MKINLYGIYEFVTLRIRLFKFFYVRKRVTLKAHLSNAHAEQRLTQVKKEGASVLKYHSWIKIGSNLPSSEVRMSPVNYQRRVKLRFINWLNSHDRTRGNGISRSRSLDFTRHDKPRLLREKNLLRFIRATIFDTSLISTRDNQRPELMSRRSFSRLNGSVNCRLRNFLRKIAKKIH